MHTAGNLGGSGDDGLPYARAAQPVGGNVPPQHPNQRRLVGQRHGGAEPSKRDSHQPHPGSQLKAPQACCRQTWHACKAAQGPDLQAA